MQPSHETRSSYLCVGLTIASAGGATPRPQCWPSCLRPLRQIVPWPGIVCSIHSPDQARLVFCRGTLLGKPGNLFLADVSGPVSELGGPVDHSCPCTSAPGPARAR